MTAEYAATDADLAAGAGVLLAYTAVLATALALAPPSPAQLERADPIVRLLLAAGPGLWAAPVLCVLPALVWGLRARSVPWRRRAVVPALAGTAVAAGGVVALRLALGPGLPAAMPPEESAAPGLTAGLAAGLVEEAIFRLLVLAGLYRALRAGGRRPAVAGTAAVLAGAAAFALAHEPGPPAFDPVFFAIRFALPGVVMGVLFLRLGPAFLVSLHGTAHLLIPVLLPGRS